MYYNTYLAHHGRKGQKWGVKNGPPYPLTQAAKKRAYGKKQESIANQTSKSITLKNNPLTYDDFGNDMDSLLIPFDDYKYEEVNPFEITDYNAVLLDGNKLVNEIKNSATERIGKEYCDEFIGPQRPTRKNISEDDAGFQSINSYGEEGRNNNCFKCGIATELYERGFDKIEAGRSRDGIRFSTIKEFFKGSKIDCDNASTSDMEKYFDTLPENASGVMNVALTNPEGGKWHHTMHWTKHKDGRVSVEDGQSGKVYDDFSEMANNPLKGTTSMPAGRFACTRLDNCEPDTDNLMRYGIVEPAGSNPYYLDNSRNKVYEKW